VSRARSHVQLLRTLEAALAAVEGDIAELCASLEAHRCPRDPKARTATILDGDPSCPECRPLRELIVQRAGIVGKKRAVESQIVRSELHAKRGRKPGSRIRDLVRAAEADLGTDAPIKALLRYVDARLPKGQKAPDESSVRKYRGKSGGN
jgi:hypothetical protein